eukprot:jgi/Chlat1/3557/Chrsp234S03554
MDAGHLADAVHNNLDAFKDNIQDAIKENIHNPAIGCAYAALQAGQLPSMQCVADVVKSVKLSYFSPTGRLPDPDCLSLVISRLLGYALVAGGALVKLPQIWAVLSAKSADGLAVESYEAETLGYAIALCYALRQPIPFSAYGELAFLLAENSYLVALLYKFSKSKLPTTTPLKVTGLVAFLGAALTGALPNKYLNPLYHMSHFIFFYARIPQILLNFRTKATGQLSFASTLLMTAGGCARIFTTIREGGSRSMLFGATVGSLLNLILLLQILAYAPKRTVPKSKKTA